MPRTIVDAPRTAAVWAGYDLGDLGATPAEQRAKVWRTRRSMSLGHVAHDSALPAPPEVPAAAPPDAGYESDILVIEDNGGGFRLNVPPPLTSFLEAGPSSLPERIVLKTCAPVGHGTLWWLLAGRKELADRLIVLVSIADLRRADVRVSQGISWERTAEDLAHELAGSAALSGLRSARHVIVTLQGEGALWMARPADPAASARTRLIFDPACMEEEWPRKVGAKGGAYGFHSAFLAAVACALATDTTEDEGRALARGIERGLCVMRAMRVLGHGPVKGPRPGLPATELGRLLSRPGLADIAQGSSAPITWTRLGSFGCAEVPAPGAGGPRWRMLEATDLELAGHPLYGKAHRVALQGTAALGNVPYARFGKLSTADREEIEALRNLKRLMDAYADARGETTPLSLAVFGPPGAGKSFGIKQIAETVIEDRRRAFLVFNLSQFDDPGDLTGALHQVRDKVLEGKLPVVFWDEFDSQDYRWLQYLLAPMQDGKFQEGQITHPIGQCVFVFAGATSYTCEDFGPPEAPASDSAADREAHRAATASFRLKKGPDFKSRLHGYLNVFGPNPRQRFNGAAWEDDPGDVCFPVRRAILLRSMLGLMDERNGARRLEMDPGLLAALLETRYKHGSRSFEKIVAALRQGGGGEYRRSALPSDEVLEMNLVDAADFKRLLARRGVLQPHAAALAAAVHAQWLQSAGPESHFRQAFGELSPEIRGDNVAAALRMCDILSLAGLELVPEDDPRPALPGVDRVLANHIETLAEEEHRGWMDVRLKNGWRLCEPAKDAGQRKRQRAERQSDCLVRYDELPEGEREKDRGTIRWYPKAAALAGLKIVAKGAW
ncbi:MAG: hypothetical protein H6Q10_2003 [Acidobacteria bacterium]|nr:hypothetical protein [Acidobacteriota bacterium]